jgi:hypothetical protein
MNTGAIAALIGIKEAVRRSGRNKGTIHRAMTSGKLPFTLSEAGTRRELERVFPGKHEAKPHDAKPKATPKRKRYRSTTARVADAAALQDRITAGIATQDEAEKYRRIVNRLYGKFRDGQLSPENARRFGIG